MAILSVLWLFVCFYCFCVFSLKVQRIASQTVVDSTWSRLCGALHCGHGGNLVLSDRILINEAGWWWLSLCIWGMRRGFIHATQWQLLQHVGKCCWVTYFVLLFLTHFSPIPLLSPPSTTSTPSQPSLVCSGTGDVAWRENMACLQREFSRSVNLIC